MNRTFGEPQLYTPQKDSTPGSPVHRGSGNRTRSELPPTPPRRSVEAPSLNLKLDALGGVSRPLVDPVLQDMGYNTRFLIDYCKSPNVNVALPIVVTSHAHTTVYQTSGAFARPCSLSMAPRTPTHRQFP